MAKAGKSTAGARRTQEVRSASSRQRLVTAAAAEFAARGFAGASVDRIARGARVNKAMIYYHFQNKRALYTEVLRDMFRARRPRSSTPGSTLSSRKPRAGRGSRPSCCANWPPGRRGSTPPRSR